MQTQSFEESVQQICDNDPRYDADAYYFVREALDFVTKQIAEKDRHLLRHVSAKELLEGFREYALEEFGPLALTVFKSWGLQCTEDVGNIVFNLVNAGKLGKTDDDRIEDFSHVYDFETTFATPFNPKGTWSPPKRSVRNRRQKR